jgi:hypothetical protein
MGGQTDFGYYIYRYIINISKIINYLMLNTFIDIFHLFHKPFTKRK